MISALRPNSPADAAATVAALSGVAIPNFFLGILLIYFFAVWLRILPPSGYVAPWEDLGQNLKLMLMPSLAVSTGLAAVMMRQIRSALLEVLQQEYILTARSKGLSEWAVVIGHAFKNAAIPVVTILGQQVGTLIGGAVVTETIFSIPGHGPADRRVDLLPRLPGDPGSRPGPGHLRPARQPGDRHHLRVPRPEDSARLMIGPPSAVDAPAQAIAASVRSTASALHRLE